MQLVVESANRAYSLLVSALDLKVFNIELARARFVRQAWIIEQVCEYGS